MSPSLTVNPEGALLPPMQWPPLYLSAQEELCFPQCIVHLFASQFFNDSSDKESIARYWTPIWIFGIDERDQVVNTTKKALKLPWILICLLMIPW